MTSPAQTEADERIIGPVSEKVSPENEVVIIKYLESLSLPPPHTPSI